MEKQSQGRWGLPRRYAPRNDETQERILAETESENSTRSSKILKGLRWRTGDIIDV